MKRAEFMSIFIGFIVKRGPSWLPEESTEENMLDVMQQRITEHSDQIKKILKRTKRE